ncbi:unnamed protein product [Caenorhabditis sp. 36 PRJEB53466]|nr:unnamed protein product [Caenorhabditis sp. 36 PRJEB53466]
MVKVGIIGGSGLEDPKILQNTSTVSVETPFGKPSDDLVEGTINGVECVLLARHGRKHDIMPGNVNYRANLWALYSRGVDVIIASTACGSLQEHVEPGHLLFPDSVFDRTNGRKGTFFDGSYVDAPGVCHIQAHPTYNEKLRQVLISTAERPSLFDKAESTVFRSWGASLVNMTMMPECILAKELGIPYASTALVTDYDCWKDGDEHVTASSVMEVFAENVGKAKTLFVEAIEERGSRFRHDLSGHRHSIPEKLIINEVFQNWGWFDVHDSGELATRMSDGLERVRDAIGDKFGALVSYFATFVCGLTIAFHFSWQMTLVMLSVTPVFLGPILFSYKMMSKVTPKERKAYSEAGMHWGLRRAYLTTFGVAFVTFALFTAMALSFWFGTRMVVSGSITPGTIFTVFWAVSGAIYALAQASPQIPVFLSCHSAAAPIFEIIDRIVPIDSTSSKGELLWKVRGNVKFENVRFKYPTRPEVQVLKGVNVHANSGENIALISIDGTNIERLNIAHLRTIVGIVSQEPLLFADTVENNIRLGAPDIDDEEMEYCCRQANAHEFISQLPNGYKTMLGNGGVQLSGGQRQRLAIARTLARKPSILILDEATSALDTESESLVQTALENAKQGRTTITIAHRLSTIRNCDRIYVFDNGNVVEVGSHEELIEKDGFYAQMVKTQELSESGEENENSESVEELASKMQTSDQENSRRQISKRLSKAFSLTTEMMYSDVSQLQTEEESADESGFLEILHYARPEWILLSLAIFLSILRGCNYPIFSILYGRMFKILSTGSDEDKTHNSEINALYFTILGFASAGVTMAAGCLLGYVGERVTKRMRIRLFTNILRQDGEYFDRPEHATGRLTTRLAVDAPNIRAAIDQRLADVFQGISSILCGIGIAFSYGPAMAPIGILTCGTLISLQAIISQYLKKRGERDAVKAEEPSRLAIEAIEQYRTVQYLTREKQFVAMFENGMRPIHRRNLQRGIVQSFSYALTVSYTFFNFAIGYRYGVFLVTNRICSPFTIFQVIESLNSASTSLLAFGTYLPEYVRARVSAALLFRMLRDKPRIELDEGKKLVLKGDVSLMNVYFGYPVARRNMVLNGFSLNIPRGKTTALVGASGSGKSTTIQLLERFYDPIAGTVRFDKEGASELNLKFLRSQMALVGQQPTLFNYSIRENIGYGLDAIAEEEVIEAAKLAHAHEFITKMPEGYDTVVGEGGANYDPRSFLLDEATSALDAESEKLVQEALENAREGRTCVVIAHRLSTIRGADAIAVVKDGTVIEQGTHQQLLALGGVYANFVQKSSL